MNQLSIPTFFGKGRKVVSATAPGRLDVMGGIADYSGSLVLEMPIAEGTTAVAAKRFDGLWRAYSREAGRAGLLPLVEAPTKAIGNVAAARKFFNRNPKAAWAAYVLGCVPLLLKEKKMPACGADIHLVSEVPLAKGLSSSASVEVATLAALARLFGLSFGKTVLPVLCQRVENLVAGAPCGLMDQLTCYLGKKDRLLPILCQPDSVYEPVAIPKGIRFVGLDSGVRHWVGGSSYSEVRTAAFMGYSLIAMREGAALKGLKRARETGNTSRLPYGGYLARLSPQVFQSRYAGILPERMKGRDFLRQSVSIDPVTKVNPVADYPVLAATRHPVGENARVSRFKRLLVSLGRTRSHFKNARTLAPWPWFWGYTGSLPCERLPGDGKGEGCEKPAYSPPSPQPSPLQGEGVNLQKGIFEMTSREKGKRQEILLEMGALMFQSHASYGACGLGEPVTDALVEAARKVGPEAGVYGAKITGGGSGGTVCFLVEGKKGTEAVRRIAARHVKARNPFLSLGSSNGARWV